MRVVDGEIQTHRRRDVLCIGLANDKQQQQDDDDDVSTWLTASTAATNQNKLQSSSGDIWLQSVSTAIWQQQPYHSTDIATSTQTYNKLNVVKTENRTGGRGGAHRFSIYFFF